MTLKPKSIVFLIVATCLVLLAELSQHYEIRVDPFKTPQSTFRSWYLELSLPDLPVEVQSQLVTAQLETEIGSLPSVRKVYGISFRKKVVIGFLSDTQADTEIIKSNVSFSATKVLSKLAQSRGNDSPHTMGDFLLFHKPIRENTLRVPQINTPYQLGLTDEEYFQQEVTNLFGSEGAYSESSGFLPLLRGHIQVSLTDSNQKELPQELLARMVRDLGDELSSLRSVQAVIVKDVAQRVIDLEYSGISLLRIGVSPLAIHSALSGRTQSDNATALYKAGQEFQGSSEEANPAKSLLGASLRSDPLGKLALKDVATERPYYQLMSAVISSQGISHPVFRPIASLQLERPNGPRDASERGSKLNLQLLLEDKTQIKNVKTQLDSIFEKLIKSNPGTSFKIGSLRQFTETSAGPMRFFLYSLFSLSVLSLFFSSQFPGTRFIVSFLHSALLFSCFSIFTGLQITIDRASTAFGLFFIFGLAAELPLAKDHLLKTKRKILSERVHVLLVLLTLPVLFSIFVLGYEYSYEERQHLLTFCLSGLSVFIANSLYSPGQLKVEKEYDQEINHQSHFLIGLLSVVPLCVTIFERELFDTDPAALSYFGTIELNGSDDKSRQSQKMLTATLEKQTHADDHILTFSGIEEEQATVLKEAPGQSLVVGPSFVTDILSATQPVFEKLINVSPSQPEYVLFRVKDKELAYDSAKLDHRHRFKNWLTMAEVPCSSVLLQNNSSCQTVQLSKLLVTDQEVLPSRIVTWRAKPVALFSGYGEARGPAHTHAETNQLNRKMHTLFQELGLEKRLLRFATNTELHNADTQKSADLTWIISLLIFGSGALFFGSFKGALQTYCTYLLAYGIAKPILIFVYTFSGYLFTVSDLELQIAAMSMSLGLLTIWGRIVADTNESRKGNLTLRQAFVPFFSNSTRLYGIIFAMWSLSNVISLTFIAFRFVSGILLASFAALLIFPSWVYLWSALEEFFHRLYLKLQIHMNLIRIGPRIKRLIAKNIRVISSIIAAPILIFMFDLLGVSRYKAYAQEVVDTSCNEARYVILPFLNRPQSIESSTVNIQVTEIMSSQLPCGRTASEYSTALEQILQENKGPEKFSATLEQLKKLLKDSRPKLQSEYFSESQGKAIRFGIITGFVEELFGHTGITVVYDYGTQNESYLKFTVRNADLVPLIKEIGQYLRKNDSNILEKLEANNDLVSVFLKEIESVHSNQNPLTQVLRSEVHNFMTSRLDRPLPPDFLERKQFFRLAAPDEKPKYTLKIAVETNGPRIFASVRASQATRERSVWVEDDVTNLQSFETKLLKASRQALSSLEGIFDYSALGGPSFRVTKKHFETLLGLQLRQNRGTFAFTGRLRVGKSDGPFQEKRPQTLVLAGAAAGYQVLDFRWISFDTGLAADAGIAQFDETKTQSDDPQNTLPEANTPAPSLLAAAGPFTQLLLTLSNGITFALRLGIEAPYELSTDEKVKKPGTLLPLHFDSFAGVGYSF